MKKWLHLFVVILGLCSLPLLSSASEPGQGYTDPSDLPDNGPPTTSRPNSWTGDQNAQNESMFVGRAVGQSLAGDHDLFGQEFRLNSTLGFSQDMAPIGGLDVVVPLTGNGTFEKEANDALFLQPGFQIWQDQDSHTRYDINFGGVYRQSVAALDNAILGAGAFTDVNANYGSSRWSLGFDVQHKGFYSVVNIYRRLTNWIPSQAGYEERPLNGFDAKFALPPMYDFTVGLEGRRFYSPDPHYNIAEYGPKLSYAIDPNWSVDVGNYFRDGDSPRQEVELHFVWPPQSLAQKVAGDLYRVFEREKRIFFERRKTASASLTVNATTLARNGSVAIVTASLSQAAAQATIVTFNFSGNATLGTDYTVSSNTVTIPAGQTTGQVSVTAVTPASFRGNANIVVSAQTNTNVQFNPGQVVINLGPSGVPSGTTLSLTSGTLPRSSSTTLTLHLGAAVTQSVDLSLSFSGTAVKGVDYTVTPAYIHIPSGQTDGSVTIAALPRTSGSGNVTLIVSVASISTNGTITGRLEDFLYRFFGIGRAFAADSLIPLTNISPVTLTITDPAATTPTVTLSRSAASLAENGGTATITATLSASTQSAVTINLGFAGTATRGTDYSASSTSITIPANQTSGTITLTGINNNVYTGNQTIITSISSITGNATDASSAQTVTITDAQTQPTVTLSRSAASFAENGGTATITATLSAAIHSSVTVNLGFAGTATRGTDYTASSTSITIPANSTTGTITLTGVNNGVYTGDQTIITSVSSITGTATDASSAQTVTITDAQSQPTITLSRSVASLGENGGTATITATLSTAIHSSVTVNLGFAGTATRGTDYTASSTSITIPANSTTGTITLTGVNNGVYTGDQTIVTSVSSITGTATDASAAQTVTITDAQSEPTITLSRSATNLGENGGTATITATLSAAIHTSVTVNLSFAGTATRGTDYSASATSITIPANSTTGTITLTGINNNVYTGDQTIITSVSSITGSATDASSAQTVTITDAQSEPTITLSRSAASLTENGGTATITATLSAAIHTSVTVNLGFAGTATRGTDYTASATSITIPANSTTGTITLTGVNNGVYTGDQTIITSVSSITGTATDASAAQTVTITDNQSQPTITLSRSAATLGENGGTATITATLSAAIHSSVTVNLGFAGTATRGTDYSASAMSITIPANSTTGTITLTGINNNVYTGDQTIVTSVSSITGTATDASAAQTVTITDAQSEPTITLSRSAASLGENGGTATITATLSAAIHSSVTVNLGFAGTATRGTDYSASATSITIPANSTTGTITLTGINNNVYTGDQTIVTSVSSITGTATDASAAQTVTITDAQSEPTITLSRSAASLTENGGTATITATLSAAIHTSVTVNLGFAGTATRGTDYTASSTSITIPANSTTGTITLTGVNNGVYTGDQTIITSVSSITGTATDGSSAQTVTITDMQSQPTITLSRSAASLGENGGTATITATLSAAIHTSVTVNLGFAGTATRGTDYTASATSITIPANSTTGTITLTGVNNNTYTGDQTIITSVSSITGTATDASSAQTVTITDAQTQPTVTLSVSPSSMSKSGGTSTVTATLSVAVTSSVTVNLGFAGTATKGTNYTSSANAITISANQTTGTITLTGVSTGVYIGSQTVVLSVSSITGTATDSGATPTVTITDSQAAPNITLSLSGGDGTDDGGHPYLTEGSGSTISVTMISDAVSTYNMSADVSISFDQNLQSNQAAGGPGHCVITAGTQSSGTCFTISAPDTGNWNTNINYADLVYSNTVHFDGSSGNGTFGVQGTISDFSNCKNGGTPVDGGNGVAFCSCTSDFGGECCAEGANGGNGGVNFCPAM